MSGNGDPSGRVRRNGWRPPLGVPKPSEDPDRVLPNVPAAESSDLPTDYEEVADPRLAPKHPHPAATFRRSVAAGEVSGLGMASLPSGTDEVGPVVLFRLEARDKGGTRTGITPVRLHGAGAVGFAENGDWVEVTGRFRKGTLYAKKAWNRSTGASFQSSPFIRRLIIAAFIVFFLAVLAFIISIAVQMGQLQTPSPEGKPLPAPQNLRVESQNGCAVTLTWDAVDNVSVGNYHLYDNSTFVGLVDGQFNSKVVQMFPGDEPSYTVVASDKNNMSEPSNTVKVGPC